MPLPMSCETYQEIDIEVRATDEKGVPVPHVCAAERVRGDRSGERAAWVDHQGVFLQASCQSLRTYPQPAAIPHQ